MVSKEKIRRCLDTCLKKTSKPNLQKSWKENKVIKSYSFKIYKNIRDQKKLNKAYNSAVEGAVIYQEFIDFCKTLYNKNILRVKVKRSAKEFIKEFKKINNHLSVQKHLEFMRWQNHHIMNSVLSDYHQLKSIVGGVLIASVTSIPELISEISQALYGKPAASISNELSSNAFFLLFLSL